MSTFYLINTTYVGTQKYLAGHSLDDSKDPVSAIQAAGGVAWPSSDATVATAAALVQAGQKNKGWDEFQSERVMFAAATNSLLGQTSAPLSNATPQPTGETASAGVAAAASRADHAHANPDQQAAVANLTDTATQTLTPVAGGGWYKLPTLSQGGTLTVNAGAAVAGDQIQITRTDTHAFTYAIVNGGVGGGTLATMPVSKANSAMLQFDGTNWALRQIGTQ